MSEVDRPLGAGGVTHHMHVIRANDGAGDPAREPAAMSSDLAPIFYAADLRACPDLPEDVIFVGRQWLLTRRGVESMDGRHAIAANHLRDGLAEGRGHVFSLATDPAIDADDLAVAIILGIAMLGQGALSPREALTIRRQAARRRAEAGGARRKATSAPKGVPAVIAPDDINGASTGPGEAAEQPIEPAIEPATKATLAPRPLDPERLAMIEAYTRGVAERRAARAAARAAKRAAAGA